MPFRVSETDNILCESVVFGYFLISDSREEEENITTRLFPHPTDRRQQPNQISHCIMLSRCIIIIFCALLATKLVLSESTAGIAEAVRQYDLLQQQQPPDDPVAEDEKREDEVPPLIRSPKVVTFVVFAGDDEKYDDLVHAVQCVPLCKDLRIGCLPEEKDALEYRIVRVGPHTSVVSAAQAIGFGPGEAGRYRATIILAYGLVGIETAAAAAITRSAIVRMEPSINTIRCSADGKMLDVPPLYVESPLALRSMQR